MMRFLLAAALALVCATTARAQGRIPVWIDTDPAIGIPERDVDDGFALIQAFHSPELAIRGISVVFGNSPLDRGVPIASQLAREFGPSGLHVYPGASGPAASPTETAASRALARALRREPLTILALGPATNVAAVIERHPDLASRVTRVIAVAGRRPGQRFTTGTTNLKGHRDFNFELDPAAFRTLLASGVPLVLAPFEISSKVWIDEQDVQRLASGNPAAHALAGPATAWLAMWRRLWDVRGFNPFDTLAVGYAVAPDGFGCETLPVDIRTLPDDATEPGVQGTTAEAKPFLLASNTLTGATSRAVYCSVPPPGFKADLLQRLSGSR